MLGQEYIKAEKKDNKTEKKFYDFGPPPDTQTDPPFLYQKKQKPNKLYHYRNSEHELEFVIFRDNTKVDKKIEPYSYSRSIKAWTKQLPKEFKGDKKYKRTLLRAEILADTYKQSANNNFTVLIVEGEKTLEKAEELFESPVVLTWCNGTRSIHKSDWSHVKDVKVYLWPDNDKEGFDAMLKIGKMLEKQGCEVWWVHVPDEFPPKWDLADNVPKSYEGTLQELLDNAEHFIKAQHRVDPNKFDLLNAHNFVWVKDAKSFWKTDSNEWYDKDQLNAEYLRYNQNPFKHLLKQPELQHVNSTAYYPRRPMIFEKNNKRLLNAYHPPMIMGVDKDITWWKNELDRFFGKDDEEQHYYNQVIAHLVQNPDKKLPFCYHKGGVQGNGKSIKDRVVMSLIGKENGIVIDNATLQDKYNDYLINKLVVCIEELNVSSKKKAEMMNRIKVPISSDEHVIEMKFKPRFIHHCPTRFFSNSNFITPVFLEESDRRFALYWSSSQRWEKDYYFNFKKHMEDESCIEGLHYFYSNYDLKGFDETYPRMNSYKQSLMVNATKKLWTYLDDRIDQLDDLINVEDIRVEIQSAPTIYDQYGKSRDPEFYLSTKEIFDWAISRGGRPLERKSIRTKNGKKNLIALRNFETWNIKSEGEIKEYYKPLSFLSKNY